MVIKLEGDNKQLLREYIEERYEAQKAEKNSKWYSFKKHSDISKYKLKFILNNLKIDTRLNTVQVDAKHGILMVTRLKGGKRNGTKINRTP
ncbi:hypothetical protein AGR56_09000 [Clostridium sp. DMHC 10]|uniref:hypothetical protein n=1 Tax=Clostridium sp. DMHC 10 TaxID=747377 RepID=UPI00069FA084|nr:hypothetical protein [Clostridium sp. DMHC 10]KOF56793.1 hypothetical protein AGR56_09000 [Clostridium sp. DMHC 10]